MKISESLQERLPEGRDLQRSVMFNETTGALCTSAVLVRVPPHHRFPLHIHPRSEDCFFVLSGSGELVGEDQTFPISESTIVWVPVGVPHGVVAGPLGMFEIGFQSPPGSTVSHVKAGSEGPWPRGMLVESLPTYPQSENPLAEWLPVFQGLASRYLHPHYCILDASQQLHAEADGYELAVIIVRGAIELPELSKHVGAIAALQFSPGEGTELRALNSPTLLLGIRALVAA